MTSKPDSLVSQTGPSGFDSFRIEEYIEDYRTQDGSSTSLVSSRPHAQLEEEDPVDKGAEDEGGSGQEEERRALQQHPAGDPDKVGVEGEGEG
jgi:hypothetical protein